MSALLTVKGLEVEFVDRGAVTGRPLRGIDLEIDSGEILGLVGETGCGKSLTGLAVLGQLPKGARALGSITLDGHDQLHQDHRSAVTRGDIVSLVFQNPGTAFNPVFTIEFQLLSVLRRHRQISAADARARVQELLGLVGLPDPARVMRSFPHEMSGGMLQRAMIAMALLCEPKLLILDEPTTALDVTVAQQILQLVVDLQRQLGFSVLLITHNLGVVRDVCDRVAVLYAGRVVETGTCDEVLDAPAHPYSRGLLGALPRNHDHGERLTAIPGTVPGNLLGMTGCAFRERCPRAISSCAEVDPTLEPVDGSGHTAACIRVEAS